MITYSKIEFAKGAIRACGTPRRVKILKQIIDSPGITQMQLRLKFRVSQSIMSQTLKPLIAERFIYTKREGKNILYFPNHEYLDQFQVAVDLLIKVKG